MSESHDIEQIARVLAERFWSVHPSEIRGMNLTRQQFYEREIIAALSAAEAKGAANMRERAADTASSVGSIERAIRALPPIKEG